jgi:transcriptional regulator with XRE-family HTH domain
VTEATTAETRKELGRILRRKREERELSQAVLAQRTGLDQASISRVEAGTASFDSMMLCAKELGVVITVGDGVVIGVAP